MLEVVLRGGGCWQSHRSPGVFIAFCVAEGCIVTFIALVHMVDATQVMGWVGGWGDVHVPCTCTVARYSLIGSSPELCQERR